VPRLAAHRGTGDLNTNQSVTLSVPLLCRGDAEQLDLSLGSIAVAAKATGLWLEVQVVPWQLTPSGLERVTAALASHGHLIWLQHDAPTEAAALNQAWRQARGAWIWWLEAGDQLMAGALGTWLDIVSQQPDLLLVAGEGEHLDGDGQVLRRHRAPPASTWVPQLTIQGLYCPGAIVWRHSLLALSGPLREEHGPAHLQLSLMETLTAHSPRCLAVPELWVRSRSASDWQAPGRCRGQALTLTQCLAGQLGDSPGDMLHNYGLHLQRGEALPPPGRTWLAELADAITTAKPLLSAATLLRLRQGWGLDPEVQPWQELLETHLAEARLEDLWCVTLLRSLLHPELGALQLGSPWGPNLRLAGRLLSPELWGQYRLLRQDAGVLEVLNQSVRGLPLIGLLLWLEQPQLQQRFPLPEALHPYGRWWADHAQAELSHIRFGADGLIEAEPFEEYSGVAQGERPFGVNLIGHAFEVFGIGEDVRMAALALSSAAVPFCVVNVPANNGASRGDRSLEPQTLPPGKLGPYRFNLVCLAAPSHGAWIAREGMAQQRGRTTIVAWPWETQTWPRAWECLIPLADVFWPSSTFTAQALKPFSDPCRRPMQVMPMAVHIDNPKQYRQTERRQATRERWGLDPAAKLVLFVFDIKSSLARKNPWGAIDAFQHAFSKRKSNQVQLVIKALRPIGPNVEWEKLQRQASEDPRLMLIDKDLERQELLELMGCCDVFLSMHRSEGFGRGIAEAGILGLEVVTSSFGGNADFCLGSSFYLVTCSPSAITANAYPQAEGHIWGEPNREEAIQHLQRTTRSQPPVPAVQNSNPILDQLTKEACGQRYVEELNKLLHLLTLRLDHQPFPTAAPERAAPGQEARDYPEPFADLAYAGKTARDSNESNH
jgi:glycosyltransferase involved in cell wall biosynthesis